MVGPHIKQGVGWVGGAAWCQAKEVHSVWLLDLSYLILRNEQRFPELALRLQAPVRRSSVWSGEHWARVFWNTCLVIYCLPEVHLWGLTGRAYVRLRAAAAAYFGGQRPTDEQESAMKEVVAALESNVMMSPVPDRPRKRSTEVQGDAATADEGGGDGRSRGAQAGLGRKVEAFARREGIAATVRRWGEASAKDGRPVGRERFKSLYLVALITQLDRVLRSMKESHRTVEVRRIDEDTPKGA